MKRMDAIIEALKNLEDRNGRLTPTQVVNAARDESSPLHSCFEWDDGLAAESWRIEQARELIRSVKVKVTYEDVTFKVVKYVPDVEKPDTEQGYIATMRIKKKSVGASLIDELSNAVALLVRTQGIAASRGDDLPDNVIQDIESVIGQLNALINSIPN